MARHGDDRISVPGRRRTKARVNASLNPRNYRGVSSPPSSETAPRDRTVSGSSVLRTRGGWVHPGENTVRDYGPNRRPTPGHGIPRAEVSSPPLSERAGRGIRRRSNDSPPRSEQRFTGNRGGGNRGSSQPNVLQRAARNKLRYR